MDEISIAHSDYIVSAKTFTKCFMGIEIAFLVEMFKYDFVDGRPMYV
jgi:hypothetical protein